MVCIYSADYSITSFKQRHVRPDNPQLHCLSAIWVTGSKDKRNRSSPPGDSLKCVWFAPEKCKTSKKLDLSVGFQGQQKEKNQSWKLISNPAPIFAMLCSKNRHHVCMCACAQEEDTSPGTWRSVNGLCPLFWPTSSPVCHFSVAYLIYVGTKQLYCR